MSWNIGLFLNKLFIETPEARDELEDLCSDYDMYITIDHNNSIWFDGDAGEHQDFLWEDWFEVFAKKHKLTGTVIWGSVEGDNRGKIWGYELKKGKIKKLDMKESLKVLLKEQKNEQ